MKRHRNDVIALGLFTSIVCIFFWQIVVGKLPVPSDALVGLYHPWRDLYASAYPRGIPFKNFLITDPVRQQIPWRKIVIDQWKMGQVPSWNPFNFSGSPLAGNIQAAAFYPLNLLFFFLSFPWAWTVLIVSEPLLAGVFLYAYLRHLKLSSLSSLYGAISWSFSGFMIAWLTWGTIVHVVLWLPLILLAIDKLKDERTRWSVVLVVALSAQFFAGHAQMSLYIVAVACVYALWKRERSFWIPLLLAAGVTSVQWIPLISTVSQSSRVVQADAWKAAGWFLPWQHLAQFFAPDFFGNPATLNYWGEWNYGEFIGYISIVGLIFALFSLVAHKRSAIVTFWGWTAAIILIFLLPTPIASLPYVFNIPVLVSLQPTRLLAILDFALVVLAAVGLERWRLEKDTRIWLSIGSIGIVLLALWGSAVFFHTANAVISQRNLVLPSIVYGISVLCIAGAGTIRTKNAMKLASLAIIVVVTVDLVRFGWKFTPFTPHEYFFPRTAVIEFLQRQPKPFRVMSTDPRIIPPNTLAFYGIESIEGYDPIYPSRYEEFMAAVNRGKPDISPPFGFNRILTATTVGSPLLEYMNVPYVLALSDLNNNAFEKVFQEGEVRVYKSASMPRAYLVEGVRVVGTKQEAIQALYAVTLPRKEAIVEENIHVDPMPLNQGEKVDIVGYETNRMELVTRTNYARYVVTGSMYDSGWHVYVDGAETSKYRTNYLFFGIVVPPGEHRITVQYR